MFTREQENAMMAEDFEPGEHYEMLGNVKFR